MSSRKRSSRTIQRAIIDALEPRQLLTTFNPVDGPAFATALTNAQLGDTIILNAGSTYTGNFVMKNKTGYQINEVYVAPSSSKNWGTVRDIAVVTLRRRPSAPAAAVRTSSGTHPSSTSVRRR